MRNIRDLGTECCSAVLPHQPGELHLASCDEYFLSWHDKWFEKKPLELCTGNEWNHALHITMVHYLKYWSHSWKGLSIFSFSRDAARKDVFAVWQALLKLGRSCGVWEWAVATSLQSTSQRSPLSTSKRTTTLPGEGWSFLPLAGMQHARKMNVLAAREASLKMVEPVAFVNGLWLAHRRLPCKGTVLKLTTVQLVNGLRPSN